MGRYDLSEAEWRIVEPLLPPVGKGARREDDRRIVNGIFYVLDRVTGEFLLGKPYTKVNWTSGLDAKGRPALTPQPAGDGDWIQRKQAFYGVGASGWTDVAI